MSEAINVQVIMEEIRERVRQQTQFQDSKPFPALPSGFALPDFTDMEGVSRRLRGRQAAIGQMPPEPATLRGRVGSLLVRMVRRALFWQTLQLQGLHADLVEGYDQQLAALKKVVAETQQNRQLTRDLWTQVSDLSTELARVNGALQAQQAATKRLLQSTIGAESQSRRSLENRLDAESQLRDNLSQRLAAEIAAEADAREELSRRVDAEVGAREELQRGLGTESTARDELGRRVDAEVAAREGLQHSLVAEAGAREELGRRVDAEVAAREGLQHALGAAAGATEELGRRVDAEVAAREGLQHSLGAEAGAREELGRRVDAEVAAREGLQHAWVAEAGAREELGRRVDAEVAAREGLQHAWVAEAGAREELGRRVDAEVAAREGLQHAWVAEAGAREELGRRVDAEVAAREGLRHAWVAEAHAREELARAVAENVQGRQQLEANHRQADIALHRLRADLSSHGARISTLLAEARKRLPKDFDAAQLAKLSDGDSNTFDSLYLALEDRFRGSREEIKERLRYYLPVLQNQHIGVRRMPVLDLGCGRGEWLELLSESGLVASGVDANRILVAACKERGLNVVEQDALEHLRALPDASVGAVTGFHIVEHLPLDFLLQLVDETIRVLKPGGMAIFETPNPQNVLVGCHNFYIDPTHRRPIPCLLAQFILEARGLCNVELVQLHPYPESFRVRDGGVELAQRFNDYFYGPQDYAVIGRRV